MADWLVGGFIVVVVATFKDSTIRWNRASAKKEYGAHQAHNTVVSRACTSVSYAGLMLQKKKEATATGMATRHRPTTKNICSGRPADRGQSTVWANDPGVKRVLAANAMLVCVCVEGQPCFALAARALDGDGKEVTTTPLSLSHSLSLRLPKIQCQTGSIQDMHTT